MGNKYYWMPVTEATQVIIEFLAKSDQEAAKKMFTINEARDTLVINDCNVYVNDYQEGEVVIEHQYGERDRLYLGDRDLTEFIHQMETTILGRESW